MMGKPVAYGIGIKNRVQLAILEVGRMVREKALEVLNTHNAYGVALENHCIRLALFATALAKYKELDVDEDLLYAGAYLHDIGLLVPNDDTPNYLYRGAAFIAPFLTQWKLTKSQMRQMNDMLLYNHAFRTVPGITPIAELLRQAVWVEHTLGKWSHGLSRQTCTEMFVRYPRNGLNAVLADFTRISLKRDGAFEVFRLFFPISTKGV